MKHLLKLGFFLAPLAMASVAPVFAQTEAEDYYQQWIDYRDGEISVAFERTPLKFALHAFHARTGFQIIVPSTTEAKVVSLRLDRQPLEPAVRSLISTIGYRNYAVMYDENGRPHRAVVLGAQPVETAAPVQNAEVAAAPITLEERDQIKKDLDRWNELKQEERGRVEVRLKTLPSSEDREILVKEYGRQLLGITK
jgi:type II secretory pathway component GspD/PulD (secretin)